MSVERLRQGLKEHLSERVSWDPKVLEKMSRDQSIYQVTPLAVVAPRDVEDMINTLRIAGECGVPVTPRGGGSGTAGAALGGGIVLHFRRDGPLSWFGDVEGSGRDAHIEAGPAALHDQMQMALGWEGLFLPADPSSSAFCLVGGNVATKASGPHALKHGSIDRYLVDVELVLADGRVVRTADPETIPAALVEGLASLHRRIGANEEVRGMLESRRDMKIASGYNLFPFLDEFDVRRLVCLLMAGSAGTLGLLSRVRLRAEPRPEGHVSIEFFFSHMREACEVVPELRRAGAAAIEIMNRRTIHMVGTGRAAGLLPPGECHLLLVEFSGEGCRDAAEEAVATVLSRGFEMPAPPVLTEDKEKMDRLWALRKALLPIVRGAGGSCKALSVVNDVGVDSAKLADFISDVERVFDGLGLEAAIYGHAGSGNLHLRPLFDMKRPDLLAVIERTATEIYELVFRYGGTIAAEHGMGPLRAPFLEGEWGEATTAIMREVKDLFDPEGRLNPGAMFPRRPFMSSLISELGGEA